VKDTADARRKQFGAPVTRNVAQVEAHRCQALLRSSSSSAPAQAALGPVPYTSVHGLQTYLCAGCGRATVLAPDSAARQITSLAFSPQRLVIRCLACAPGEVM